MRQCPTGGKGLGDLRIRQALCAYRQGRLKRVLSVYTQIEHDQNLHTIHVQPNAKMEPLCQRSLG